MKLKDSHQNQAYPTDLQDRICEGASNIIGNIKQTVPKINIQVCFTLTLKPVAYGTCYHTQLRVQRSLINVKVKDIYILVSHLNIPF